MKERPIIFGAPMVHAILEGRKTQTRRIVKPVGNDDAFVLLDHGNGFWPYRSDDGESSITADGNETPHSCPYGRQGDRLWVRERCELTTDDCEPGCMSVRYLADGEVRDIGTGMPDSCPGLVDWINGRWSRPSIHMPRWASRITLEVTGVRVERLQDITPADCVEEGYQSPPGTRYAQEELAALDWYRDLWESIHGDGSWSANPWVWVIEFRRIS